MIWYDDLTVTDDADLIFFPPKAMLGLRPYDFMKRWTITEETSTLDDW